MRGNRLAGTFPYPRGQKFSRVLYLDQGQALNAQTGKPITGLWHPGDSASALVLGDGRVAAVTDPRVADLYGLPGF